MGKTQAKRSNPIWVAQDILSRRDHSEAEVKQKLQRKGFSSTQIAATLAWLHEKKLLNDRLFAERYVASVLRGKAVGRRWLSQKLREKGVPAATSEAVIGEALSSEREKELVQQAAKTWQRLHPATKDDQVRLQRFLLSRGFSFEVIEGATLPADV